MYTTSTMGQPPPEPPGRRPPTAVPLSPEILEELRAPFPEAVAALHPLATSADGEVAVSRAYLDPAALRRRLEGVLGVEGFAEAYEVVEAGATYTAVCRLRIGPVERTGAGSSTDVQGALREALLDAARAFGMGAEIAGIGNVALRRTESGWTRIDGPAAEAPPRRKR